MGKLLNYSGLSVTEDCEELGNPCDAQGLLSVTVEICLVEVVIIVLMAAF